MPIRPAPSATYSSVPAAFPFSTIRNAIEAKMIGCRMLIRMKNMEFVRLFRWKSQPTPSSRSMGQT